VTIESFTFGAHGGVPVPGFTLHNRRGVTMKVIAYGAAFTRPVAFRSNSR
jgi:hypothetical protein